MANIDEAFLTGTDGFIGTDISENAPFQTDSVAHIKSPEEIAAINAKEIVGTYRELKAEMEKKRMSLKTLQTDLSGMRMEMDRHHELIKQMTIRYFNPEKPFAEIYEPFGKELDKLYLDKQSNFEADILKLETEVASLREKVFQIQTLMRESVLVELPDEERTRLSNTNLCGICIERAVGFAFHPCGHTVCGECLGGLRGRCHICRKNIAAQVKLYFS